MATKLMTKKLMAANGLLRDAYMKQGFEKAHPRVIELYREMNDLTRLAVFDKKSDAELRERFKNTSMGRDSGLSLNRYLKAII